MVILFKMDISRHPFLYGTIAQGAPAQLGGGGTTNG
jgi:hypothetical protein